MAKPDTLDLEIDHCLAATHYLNQLIQTSFPNPQGDQINFNAHNVAMFNRLLGQLISADNSESLQVSHQQFNQYMDALAESLDLRKDSDDVLGQYEYFLGFLNDVYGIKYAERADYVANHYSQMPGSVDHWTERFQQLKSAQSEQEFENTRKAILHELLEDKDNKRVQEILFYGLLKSQVDELVERRSSYLKSHYRVSRFFKDIGLMAAGAAILGVATFFAVNVATFFVPAVILAAGVVAYGVVDTFIALKDLDKEANGEPEAEKNLIQLPTGLKDQYDLENLKERRQALIHKVKRERLLLSMLGTGTSIAGLGLAGLALAALFPAVTFPPALVIGIAVLSIVAIAAAATILTVKIVRSKQSQKAFKEAADKEFANEMKTFEYLNTERQIDQEDTILRELNQHQPEAKDNKEQQPQPSPLLSEAQAPKSQIERLHPVPADKPAAPLSSEMEPRLIAECRPTSEYHDAKRPLDSFSLLAKISHTTTRPTAVKTEVDIHKDEEDEGDAVQP